VNVKGSCRQLFGYIEKTHLIVLVLNDQVLSSENHERKSAFFERQDK